MGTTSFIGIVDETTVLKYPVIIGDKEGLTYLDLEARILQTIGPHRRIIGFKGLTEHGQRAHFGSIGEYLMANKQSRMAAEA